MSVRATMLVEAHGRGEQTSQTVRRGAGLVCGGEGQVMSAGAKVYAIIEKPHPDGPVKIGMTKGDVETRRRGLQGANWRQLVVWTETELFDEHEARYIEYQVHTWLSEVALNGEWFECTPQYAWHAVECAIYQLRNPLSTNEAFARAWYPSVPSGPKVSSSPVHRSVAAQRSLATKALKEGNDAIVAKHLAKAKLLLSRSPGKTENGR